MGFENDGLDDDKPLAAIMSEAAKDGGAAAGPDRDDGIVPVVAAPRAILTMRGAKRKLGASGYRGVAYHPVSKKWRARITSSTGDGRQRALGYFESKEDAARAWDAAARDLGIQEKFLNFPDEERERAQADGAQGALPALPAPAIAAPGAKEPVGDPFAAGGSRAGVSGALAARLPNPATGLRHSMPATVEDGLPAKPLGSLSSTGIKGVRTKANGTFEARIKTRGEKRRCLGRFKSLREAMLAYDRVARANGYCVNRCMKVNDLVDSDGFANCGEATNTKGVRRVTKQKAVELVSQTHDGAADGPEAGGEGQGAEARAGALVEDSAAGLEPPGGASASASASALSGPPNAAAGGWPAATAQAEPAPLSGAAEHGGLTPEAVAATPDGADLFALFILDKPGIRRFLGVFGSEKDGDIAYTTYKAKTSAKKPGKRKAGKGAEARAGGVRGAGPGLAAASADAAAAPAGGLLAPPPPDNEHELNQEGMARGAARYVVGPGGGEGSLAAEVAGV